MLATVDWVELGVRPAPVTKLDRWLLGAMVAIGAGLRLRQYFFNRPFWLDEAYLANFVTRHHLTDLLFRPSAGAPRAPATFLLVERVLVSVGGASEQIMRLLPLVASLAALVVVIPLARATLSSVPGRVLMVGLVAMSPVLFYYAIELKQYSLDVLVALVLLLLAIRAASDTRRLTALSAGGLVAPWLSDPAMFVLAAIGVSLLPVMRARGRTRVWLGMSALWVGSIGLMLGLTLWGGGVPSDLTRFWLPAFAPIPPWVSWDWYLNRPAGLTYLAFLQRGVPPVLPLPGWHSPLNLTLLLASTAGLVALGFRARRIFSIAAVSTGLVLMASALHLYPFSGRVLLFLVPLVFLAVSFLADQTYHWSAGGWGAWVLTLGVLAVVAVPSVREFISPIVRSEARWAMQILEERNVPGDYVVTVPGTAPTYDFYEHRYKLGDVKKLTTIPWSLDLTGLEVELKEIGTGRLWVVSTHNAAFASEVIERLRSYASLVESREQGTAGIYLFEFDL
jgi:hypothetical protein